ncbi:MAG: DUF456 domain-containing protein [Deltaproteobacteria bacterium]|nr:MAG: DUF456 domain-containing protein [Deltaproteobacteria bacterium]
MATIGVIIFLLVLIFGLISIIFGLPGTIIIFLATLVYGLITSFAKIKLKLILILLALTVLAELIEFAVGVIGAKKFGSSRQAIIFSIIGGIVGAIIGLPIPLGIGSVLGAFVGAFLGAFISELLSYRDLRRASRVGFGTFLGRVLGMFSKGALALIMIILILFAIF